MNYEAFRRLKNKPLGLTSNASPIDGAPLDFAGADVALLDDFSSFDDLTDIGIEESWADDFSKVFPRFKPLACVDFDAIDELDSYSEFLLLVDTASADAPVYWFSAEWWDWDCWKEQGNGFTLVSPSFAEFYASLTEA